MTVADTRAKGAIRVALVDDHGAVRRAVRGLVAAEGDLAVVGEAGTCAGAIDLVRRTEPDVLLLDLQLPDGSGSGLIETLKRARPELAIVILTMFDEPPLRERTIAAGADAYLLKDGPPQELLATVHQVVEGKRGSAAR